MAPGVERLRGLFFDYVVALIWHGFPCGKIVVPDPGNVGMGFHVEKLLYEIPGNVGRDFRVKKLLYRKPQGKLIGF